MPIKIAVLCGGLVVAGFALSAQIALSGFGAQTPGSQPGVAERTGQPLTVTGCLKTWDTSATTPAADVAAPGVTAGAPAGAVATRFMLSNVEAVSDAPGATTPAAGHAMVSRHYLLTAEATINLASHLNHKVQVTGLAQSAKRNLFSPVPTPSDPSEGDLTVPAPPSTPEAPADLMSLIPTFTVKALKMVADSCP